MLLEWYSLFYVYIMDIPEDFLWVEYITRDATRVYL